jgi:hypothetical protein
VEGKAPKDTSEVAKGKRVYKKQFGIRRPEGFYRPKHVKFNWKTQRYETVKAEE